MTRKSNFLRSIRKNAACVAIRELCEEYGFSLHFARPKTGRGKPKAIITDDKGHRLTRPISTSPSSSLRMEDVKNRLRYELDGKGFVLKGFNDGS